MPNFFDNHEYEDKVLVIDDFDYPASTDAQAVYTEGADGQNPVVREKTDTPLIKVGLTSTRFPITDSTHTSTWGADGTIISQDASGFTGVSAGTPTQGKFRLKFARSSTTEITAISIRYGSSSSDYITWTPTLPSTTTMIDLEDDLSGLSVTGAPLWTHADYLQIRATSASGTPTMDLSGLRLTMSDRETGGLWNEEAAETSLGKSLWYTSTRNTDPSILAPQQASTDVFNTVAANVTSFTYSGSYTVISRFLWQDGSAGNEVGVCFNMSDVTVASEDGYVAYLNDDDGSIYLAEFVGGTKSTLEVYVGPGFSTDTQYWIKVEVLNGSKIRVSYSQDGVYFTKVIEKVDATVTSGKVGYYVKGTPVAEFFSFEAYADQYVKFGDWSMSSKNRIRIDNIQEMNAPDRDIRILDIADSNKQVYVSDYFKSKFINVSGKIYTPTGEGDFQESVDELKKYLSKSGQSLRIGKPTNTPGVFTEHIYENAIATNLDAIRNEFYHKQFLPFNIIFQAPSGTARIPKQLTEATYTWTTSYFERTYNFKTNTAPVPFISMTLTDATPGAGDPLDSIILTNLTTGQRLTIDSDGVYNDGDTVTIDFSTSEVQLNGFSVSYTGLASDNFFQPGKNVVAYNLTRTNSVAKQNPAPTSGGFSSGNKIKGSPVAQSFVVPTSTNYPRFDIYMRANSTSTSALNNVIVRIETDSAGSPSNTLVNAGATATVLVNNTKYQYIPFVLDTTATLSATDVVWIVVESQGTVFIGTPETGTPPPPIWHRVRGTSNNALTPASYKEDTNPSTGTRTWAIVNSNYDMSFIAYIDGPTGISGTLDLTYEKRVR